VEVKLANGSDNFDCSPTVFFFSRRFIRPFKWSRLLLRTSFQSFRFIMMWDGDSRLLRLHTPEQLGELANAADREQKYRLEARETTYRVWRVNCLSPERRSELLIIKRHATMRLFYFPLPLNGFDFCLIFRVTSKSL
jgi:hypothetical protein